MKQSYAHHIQENARAITTVPHATEPRLFVDPALSAVEDRLRFDMNALVDFAATAGDGVNDASLQSAAVRFVPSDRYLHPVRGGVFFQPQILEDELRYPYIEVGVPTDPARLKPRVVNKVIRHEIGHLVDKGGTPVYTNERAVALARVGLYAGAVIDMAGALYAYRQGNPGLARDIIGAAPSLALLGLGFRPVSYALSATELHANRFAWRTRHQFNPVS
jgi:hypothetical protein